VVGPFTRIKEVDDGIWLVSFIATILRGYIDLEQKTLKPLTTPSAAAVTYFLGTIRYPCSGRTLRGSEFA